MTDSASFFVDDIRAASRKMVRELGFMQSTLAATDYPPSAVHALLEVGARGAMTAAELADFLGLDKSSVSRMVRKLIKTGELKEIASGEDRRVKPLVLTGRGHRTVTNIHAFGRKQVRTALAHLNEVQQQTVAQGLATYARSLEGQRLGTSGMHDDPVRIESGYRPGVIGRVAEMHAAFYSRHAAFGQFFESKVASGMAEFTGRLEQPCNGLWVAMQGSRIVGSIAIDGEDLEDNVAHLRWFILDDGVRRAGMGRRLLDHAMNFCDQYRFAATQLWTFRGLEAARHLYESSGFELVEEYHGKQWGEEVVEQRFVRPGFCPK